VVSATDKIESYAYNIRGACYLEMGLYQRAIQDFESALSRDKYNKKIAMGLDFARFGEYGNRINNDKNPLLGYAFTAIGTSQTGGMFKLYVSFSEKGYIELGKKDIRTGIHYAMIRGNYIFDGENINVKLSEDNFVSGQLSSNGKSIILDGVNYELDKSF
jgi:tetratricopeptide (TPR) repeat protein